jgi:DNA-binding NarL/FixJ family response regulator
MKISFDENTNVLTVNDVKVRAEFFAMLDKIRRAPAFSQQQNRVLSLIGEGLGTKDIAQAMGLDMRTVSTHRKVLMEKLSFDSQASLVLFASFRKYVCQ